MLQTEAIKAFLLKKTHADLSRLYNQNMEVQVNVSQDGGERIEGEFKGKNWIGWTDGLTTWKSFRIPYNAWKEPVYEEKPMTYDLGIHAEAIGMTGWDWKNKVSRWVAYDFDSLTNHASGLSITDMEKIKDTAADIEWVTIRKSTSGKGLHLYVLIDSVTTQNHTEHAALSRAILGTLSALTGFDFNSKIDVCGGNMWVWARKMEGTDGLELVKQGSSIPASLIPSNWKDHVHVVSGRARNVKSTYDEVAGQRAAVPLDEEHKRLINYLSEENLFWWWDQDHNALVTHTLHLKKAHEDLVLKGIFDTISNGNNLNEQNCFCFPMSNGAWSVRRFSPGVQEASCWDQDGSGWTRCYYNRLPTIDIACRYLDGIEDEDGSFCFREAMIAVKAAKLLGVHIELPTALLSRTAKLKVHKDGRLIINVEHKEHDNPLDGWLAKKGNWKRICSNITTEPMESEVSGYDDTLRHIVTSRNNNREDAGWCIKIGEEWCFEPVAHIKYALTSQGIKANDTSSLFGGCVMNPWKMVNKPFSKEYPGDREWNMSSAQLRFVPATFSETLTHPTWDKLLNHLGCGLDEAVGENGWAKANGVKTGADYLKCWIASMFQNPYAPLPYLFFYGPEDTGKSSFHESLSLLMTGGYIKGESSLTNQSSFNSELDGKVLCSVEEIDLSKSGTALNRIKDWVTAREILIHGKGETPYHSVNTTHWVQCANSASFCPTFPGDTRITVIEVDPIDPLEKISKPDLINLLEKEAPDFLSAMLNLELPKSNDRLNVPVITTAAKRALQRSNETPVETFFNEMFDKADGHGLNYSEVYGLFLKWVDPGDAATYPTINSFGKALPPRILKGRSQKNNQIMLGNIKLKTQEIDPTIDYRYVLGGPTGNVLVPMKEAKHDKD